MDPTKRPSAEEALQHDYFRTGDKPNEEYVYRQRNWFFTNLCELVVSLLPKNMIRTFYCF